MALAGTSFFSLQLVKPNDCEVHRFPVLFKGGSIQFGGYNLLSLEGFEQGHSGKNVLVGAPRMHLQLLASRFRCVSVPVIPCFLADRLFLLLVLDNANGMPLFYGQALFPETCFPALNPGL